LCSIEHLPREQIFQVSPLGGRKFIVKNDRGHLSILTRFLDGFRFAASDVVWRGRLLQFLRHHIDNFGPGGIRQLAQLIERIVQVPLGDAFLFQAD
jgi:hypothetical protein